MRSLFFFTLLFLVSMVARLEAAVIWNESVNGPLSTSNLAPTDLGTLAIGASTVSGSVQNSAGNVDVFRFVVPSNTRLDTIILVSYVSSDDLAFIAMDSGPTFPFNRQQLNQNPDETLFIGGTTFGSANAPNGTDLRPAISAGALSGGSRLRSRLRLLRTIHFPPASTRSTSSRLEP
jgi:hypothetical protein